MRYRLPLHDRMGKGNLPMLSVYSLLIGSSQICSYPEGRTGSSVGGEGVASGVEGVVRGLVELTT